MRKQVTPSFHARRESSGGQRIQQPPPKPDNTNGICCTIKTDCRGKEPVSKAITSDSESWLIYTVVCPHLSERMKGDVRAACVFAGQEKPQYTLPETRHKVHTKEGRKSPPPSANDFLHFSCDSIGTNCVPRVSTLLTSSKIRLLSCPVWWSNRERRC